MTVSRLKKIIILILTTVYFSTNVVLNALAESNVWAERRKAMESREAKPVQLASLPATFNNPQSILKQMPAVNATLPTAPKWSERSKDKLVLLPKGFRSALEGIPLNYATIGEVHFESDGATVRRPGRTEANSSPVGPSDRSTVGQSPIILLQDIHMNSEAQSNLSAVIQQLIDQNQLEMVGVEGSFARINFSKFRDFPNKQITKEVADDFMKRNAIAAPSYVGITSVNEPPMFAGIDDREAYDANVEAYRSTLKLKPYVLKDLKAAEKNLSERKLKTFSTDLKAFDDVRVAYHKGGIGLGKYVKQLAMYDVEKDFAIEQFLAAYEMESKLDFTRVDVERKQVIESLAQTLSDKELSNLMSQSLAYRMGRLSFGDYYRNLKDLCASKNIALSKTPAFDNYIRYVLLSDGIKAEKLFDALEKLEAKVAALLTKTSEEKELLDASEQLSLCAKLVEFELTPKEWERYKLVRQSDGPIVRQLGKAQSDRSTVALSDNLSSFERFYVQADIRSHKMVSNLLTTTEVRKGDEAVRKIREVRNDFETSEANKISDLSDYYRTSRTKVLVVGGFHTPQIAELLRQQNISYAVVTPKLTKIDSDSGSSYLSVFAREKTPLDKLLSGEKLFLAPRSVNAGDPDFDIPFSNELNARNSPSRLPRWLRNLSFRRIGQSIVLTMASIRVGAAAPVTSVRSKSQLTELHRRTIREVVVACNELFGKAYDPEKVIDRVQFDPYTTPLNGILNSVFGRVIPIAGTAFGVWYMRFIAKENNAHRLSRREFLLMGSFSILVIAISWCLFFARDLFSPIRSGGRMLSSSIYIHDGLRNEEEIDGFRHVVIHEFVHYMELPNDSLLAEAYTALVLRKLGKPLIIFGNLGEEIAGVAMEAVPDPVRREATIRRLVGFNRIPSIEPDLTKEFVEASPAGKKILLRRISDNLNVGDYSIPQLQTDKTEATVLGKFGPPYIYAQTMYLIAIKSYPNLEDAVRFIVKLGQAKSSEELASDGLTPIQPVSVTSSFVAAGISFGFGVVGSIFLPAAVVFIGTYASGFLFVLNVYLSASVTAAFLGPALRHVLIRNDWIEAPAEEDRMSDQDFHYFASWHRIQTMADPTVSMMGTMDRKTKTLRYNPNILRTLDRRSIRNLLFYHEFRAHMVRWQIPRSNSYFLNSFVWLANEVMAHAQFAALSPAFVARFNSEADSSDADMSAKRRELETALDRDTRRRHGTLVQRFLKNIRLPLQTKEYLVNVLKRCAAMDVQTVSQLATGIVADARFGDTAVRLYEKFVDKSGMDRLIERTTDPDPSANNITGVLGELVNAEKIQTDPLYGDYEIDSFGKPIAGGRGVNFDIDTYLVPTRPEAKGAAWIEVKSEALSSAAISTDDKAPNEMPIPIYKWIVQNQEHVRAQFEKWRKGLNYQGQLNQIAPNNARATEITDLFLFARDVSNGDTGIRVKIMDALQEYANKLERDALEQHGLKVRIRIDLYNQPESLYHKEGMGVESLEAFRPIQKPADRPLSPLEKAHIEQIKQDGKNEAATLEREKRNLFSELTTMLKGRQVSPGKAGNFVNYIYDLTGRDLEKTQKLVSQMSAAEKETLDRWVSAVCKSNSLSEKRAYLMKEFGEHSEMLQAASLIIPEETAQTSEEKEKVERKPRRRYLILLIALGLIILGDGIWIAKTLWDGRRERQTTERVLGYFHDVPLNFPLPPSALLSRERADSRKSVFLFPQNIDELMKRLAPSPAGTFWGTEAPVATVSMNGQPTKVRVMADAGKNQILLQAIDDNGNLATATSPDGTQTFPLLNVIVDVTGYKDRTNNVPSDFPVRGQSSFYEKLIGSWISDDIPTQMGVQKIPLNLLIDRTTNTPRKTFFQSFEAPRPALTNEGTYKAVDDWFAKRGWGKPNPWIAELLFSFWYELPQTLFKGKAWVRSHEMNAWRWFGVSLIYGGMLTAALVMLTMFGTYDSWAAIRLTLYDAAAMSIAVNMAAHLFYNSLNLTLHKISRGRISRSPLTIYQRKKFDYEKWERRAQFQTAFPAILRQAHVTSNHIEQMLEKPAGRRSDRLSVSNIRERFLKEANAYREKHGLTTSKETAQNFQIIVKKIFVDEQLAVYQKDFGHLDQQDVALILQRMHTAAYKLTQTNASVDDLVSAGLMYIVNEYPLSDAVLYRYLNSLGVAGSLWGETSAHPELEALLKEGDYRTALPKLFVRSSPRNQTAKMKALSNRFDFEWPRLIEGLLFHQAKRISLIERVDAVQSRTIVQAIQRKLKDIFGSVFSHALFDRDKLLRLISVNSDSVLLLTQSRKDRRVVRIRPADNRQTAKDLRDEISLIEEHLDKSPVKPSRSISGYVIRNVGISEYRRYDKETAFNVSEAFEESEAESLEDTIEEEKQDFQGMLTVIANLAQLHYALAKNYGLTFKDFDDFSNIHVNIRGAYGVTDLLALEPIHKPLNESKKKNHKNLLLVFVKLLTGREFSDLNLFLKPALLSAIGDRFGAKSMERAGPIVDFLIESWVNDETGAPFVSGLMVASHRNVTHTPGLLQSERHLIAVKMAAPLSKLIGDCIEDIEKMNVSHGFTMAQRRIWAQRWQVGIRALAGLSRLADTLDDQMLREIVEARGKEMLLRSNGGSIAVEIVEAVRYGSPSYARAEALKIKAAAKIALAQKEKTSPFLWCPLSLLASDTNLDAGFQSLEHWVYVLNHRLYRVLSATHSEEMVPIIAELAKTKDPFEIRQAARFAILLQSLKLNADLHTGEIAAANAKITAIMEKLITDAPVPEEITNSDEWARYTGPEILAHAAIALIDPSKPVGKKHLNALMAWYKTGLHAYEQFDQRYAFDKRVFDCATLLFLCGMKPAAGLQLMKHTDAILKSWHKRKTEDPAEYLFIHLLVRTLTRGHQTDEAMRITFDQWNKLFYRNQVKANFAQVAERAADWIPMLPSVEEVQLPIARRALEQVWPHLQEREHRVEVARTLARLGSEIGNTFLLKELNHAQITDQELLDVTEALQLAHGLNSTNVHDDLSVGGLLLWPKFWFLDALSWFSYKMRGRDISERTQRKISVFYDTLVGPLFEQGAMGGFLWLATKYGHLDPTTGWMVWCIFAALHISNFFGDAVRARAGPNAPITTLFYSGVLLIINVSFGLSPLDPQSILLHIALNTLLLAAKAFPQQKSAELLIQDITHSSGVSNYTKPPLTYPDLRGDARGTPGDSSRTTARELSAEAFDKSLKIFSMKGIPLSSAFVGQFYERVTTEFEQFEEKNVAAGTKQLIDDLRARDLATAGRMLHHLHKFEPQKAALLIATTPRESGDLLLSVFMTMHPNAVRSLLASAAELSKGKKELSIDTKSLSVIVEAQPSTVTYLRKEFEKRHTESKKENLAIESPLNLSAALLSDSQLGNMLKEKTGHELPVLRLRGTRTQIFIQIQNQRASVPEGLMALELEIVEEVRGVTRIRHSLFVDTRANLFGGVDVAPLHYPHRQRLENYLFKQEINPGEFLFWLEIVEDPASLHVHVSPYTFHNLSRQLGFLKVLPDVISPFLTALAARFEENLDGWAYSELDHQFALFKYAPNRFGADQATEEQFLEILSKGYPYTRPGSDVDVMRLPNQRELMRVGVIGESAKPKRRDGHLILPLTRWLLKCIVSLNPSSAPLLAVHEDQRQERINKLIWSEISNAVLAPLEHEDYKDLDHDVIRANMRWMLSPKFKRGYSEQVGPNLLSLRIFVDPTGKIIDMATDGRVPEKQIRVHLASSLSTPNEYRLDNTTRELDVLSDRALQNLETSLDLFKDSYQEFDKRRDRYRDLYKEEAVAKAQEASVERVFNSVKGRSLLIPFVIEWPFLPGLAMLIGSPALFVNAVSSAWILVPAVLAATTIFTWMHGYDQTPKQFWTRFAASLVIFSVVMSPLVPWLGQAGGVTSFALNHLADKPLLFKILGQLFVGASLHSLWNVWAPKDLRLSFPPSVLENIFRILDEEKNQPDYKMRSRLGDMVLLSTLSELQKADLLDEVSTEEINSPRELAKKIKELGGTLWKGADPSEEELKKLGFYRGTPGKIYEAKVEGKWTRMESYSEAISRAEAEAEKSTELELAAENRARLPGVTTMMAKRPADLIEAFKRDQIFDFDGMHRAQLPVDPNRVAFGHAEGRLERFNAAFNGIVNSQFGEAESVAQEIFSLGSSEVQGVNRAFISGSYAMCMLISVRAKSNSKSGNPFVIGMGHFHPKYSETVLEDIFEYLTSRKDLSDVEIYINLRKGRKDNPKNISTLTQIGRTKNIRSVLVERRGSHEKLDALTTANGIFINPRTGIESEGKMAFVPWSGSNSVPTQPTMSAWRRIIYLSLLMVASLAFPLRAADDSATSQLAAETPGNVAAANRIANDIANIMVQAATNFNAQVKADVDRVVALEKTGQKPKQNMEIIFGRTMAPAAVTVIRKYQRFVPKLSTALQQNNVLIDPFFTVLRETMESIPDRVFYIEFLDDQYLGHRIKRLDVIWAEQAPLPKESMMNVQKAANWMPFRRMIAGTASGDKELVRTAWWQRLQGKLKLFVNLDAHDDQLRFTRNYTSTISRETVESIQSYAASENDANFSLAWGRAMVRKSFPESESLDVEQFLAGPGRAMLADTLLHEEAHPDESADLTLRVPVSTFVSNVMSETLAELKALSRSQNPHARLSHSMNWMNGSSAHAPAARWIARSFIRHINSNSKQFIPAASFTVQDAGVRGYMWLLHALSPDQLRTLADLALTEARLKIRSDTFENELVFTAGFPSLPAGSKDAYKLIQAALAPAVVVTAPRSAAPAVNDDRRNMIIAVLIALALFSFSIAKATDRKGPKSKKKKDKVRSPELFGFITSMGLAGVAIDPSLSLIIVSVGFMTLALQQFLSSEVVPAWGHWWTWNDERDTKSGDASEKNSANLLAAILALAAQPTPAKKIELLLLLQGSETMNLGNPTQTLDQSFVMQWDRQMKDPAFVQLVREEFQRQTGQDLERAEIEKNDFFFTVLMGLEMIPAQIADFIVAPETNEPTIFVTQGQESPAVMYKAVRRNGFRNPTTWLVKRDQTGANEKHYHAMAASLAKFGARIQIEMYEDDTDVGLGKDKIFHPESFADERYLPKAGLPFTSYRFILPSGFDYKGPLKNIVLLDVLIPMQERGALVDLVNVMRAILVAA